jgi:hypothetical protein
VFVVYVEFSWTKVYVVYVEFSWTKVYVVYVEFSWTKGYSDFKSAVQFQNGSTALIVASHS